MKDKLEEIYLSYSKILKKYAKETGREYKSNNWLKAQKDLDPDEYYKQLDYKATVDTKEKFIKYIKNDDLQSPKFEKILSFIMEDLYGLKQTGFNTSVGISNKKCEELLESGNEILKKLRRNLINKKELNKKEYIIKFWETEQDREQGTPFEYLNTPQNLEQAITEAKEMQEKNNYASVEVQDTENNKVLFYKDSEEEMYFGEAICYKPFILQDTNFYKYFKEQLEMIKDSYENPSEYNLDKLDNKDIDKIVDNLLEDNYFNQTINSMLQDELENYASKINKQQSEEEEI